MSGNVIRNSAFNNSLTAINNARSKNGLGTISNQASTGNKAMSSDYNKLITWLEEARSRAGASVSMPTQIQTGSYMVENSLNSLTIAGNAVYNWCKCHGSCYGSCTGGCSGGCKASCTSCNGCDWTSSDSGD